jgi:hypothetical protein
MDFISTPHLKNLKPIHPNTTHKPLKKILAPQVTAAVPGKVSLAFSGVSLKFL